MKIREIGDEAAVSSLLPGNDLVSTVDLLIEDVHFELSWITPRQLGRKSLAVNLSDPASIGATPRWMLISLAFPSRLEVEFIDDFFFSSPPDKASELHAQAKGWPCGITRIGRIEPLAHGVVIRDEKGPVDPSGLKGYDHFA